MIDENNKNNINNNNTINIKKLSKKIDEIIKIEKNEQISYKNLRNQSIKYLLYLKSDLENFKLSQQKKINLNIPIRNEFFKKNIFSHLYELLLTCLYIDNPNIRKDRIKHLYNWYTKKLEFYNSLDRIKERTDKNPNEKIQEFIQKNPNEIIIKDEEYEINDFKQHRSEIPDLEPPKSRLNDFIIKKINPIKKYKQSETSYNNRKFDLMRFKGRVGSKNNLITLKSVYNKNNTQQEWISNSGISVDNNLNPIDFKKEVKSSYSYNRTKYEINSINYEKIIGNEKNKIIQEKRYLEEFNLMMKDYGKKKAIFNEKKERKKSMEDVVNTYEYLMKNKKNNNNNDNRNKSVCYDSSKAKKIFNKVNKIDDKTNINNKLMYTKIENINNNNNKNNNENINNKNNNNEINNKNNNEINNNNIQISPSKTLNFHSSSTSDISYKNSDTMFLTKAHNPIFYSRILSSKICNINLIDDKKDNYFQHFNPLSAFDNKNYETFKHKQIESKEKKNRPRTASEFVIKNYKKYENNFLQLRKEMNKFEENEINDIKNMSFYNNLKEKEKIDKEKINKKLFKHSQSVINIQNFNGGFNPIFNQIAQRPVLEKLGSLVKLPRPETALLKKPPPIPTEKKKNKKKRFGF